MENIKKIAIVGSNHLGQQILHHINTDTNNCVIGFFDDFKQVGEKINNVPIIGNNNDILPQFLNGTFDCILLAIGYNHLKYKRQLYLNLKDAVPFYTFIHSSTIIDPTAIIGCGSVIYPGCVIDQNCIIGENVLLNLSCTISHDSKIGNHSFISPNNAIAGFVDIGECNFLGINSTLIDNICVTDFTHIAAGAVITRNIDKVGLYAGVPAKFIK